MKVWTCPQVYDGPVKDTCCCGLQDDNNTVVTWEAALVTQRQMMQLRIGRRAGVTGQLRPLDDVIVMRRLCGVAAMDIRPLTDTLLELELGNASPHNP